MHPFLYLNRMLVMASQVNESQGEMRMHESCWSGQEEGYQRTIKKLETKVCRSFE